VSPSTRPGLPLAVQSVPTAGRDGIRRPIDLRHIDSRAGVAPTIALAPSGSGLAHGADIALHEH
jgi:hypothetical protein